MINLAFRKKLGCKERENSVVDMNDMPDLYPLCSFQFSIELWGGLKVPWDTVEHVSAKYFFCFFEQSCSPHAVFLHCLDLY